MTNTYVNEYKAALEDANGERIDKEGQRLPEPGSELGLSRMSGDERTEYLLGREAERFQALKDCPW